MFERRVKQLRLDYGYLFGGEVGQRVLIDILRAGHVLDTVVAEGADGRIDPIKMAVREGERNMALRILTILRWSEIDLQKLSQTVVQDVDNS